MSDDYEYEYEDGGDAYEYDEDGGGGGAEEVGDDDPRVAIENDFVVAEDMRGSSPREALALFEKVVTEEEKNFGAEVTWRFKALVHVVELTVQLSDAKRALSAFEQLLALLPKVTANEGNEALDTLLEEVSSRASDAALQRKMFETALRVLKGKNEGQWFSTQLKLAKAYVRDKDAPRLGRAIQELLRACQLPSGEEDPSKASKLMDVYVLKIQLCAVTRNYTNLKVLYDRVNELAHSAVADPLVVATARETFGEMHMSQRNWQEAYMQFFEAFKAYQAASNARAVDCLKYVLLANMVATMDVDPFDSQEAKAFENHPQIKAMVQLRAAYEEKDPVRFERILRDPANLIEADALIRQYLGPLLLNFRAQVVLRMVKPYESLRLAFIARELNISDEEVESLVVSLILDRRLDGSIDQVAGVLRLHAKAGASSARIHTSLAAAMESLAQFRAAQFAASF